MAYNEEMSSVDTATRLTTYCRDGRRMTARQRRRMVKKAGRDPLATVVRDDGMGYPPAKQGYRELIGIAPVSGAPTEA